MEILYVFCRVFKGVSSPCGTVVLLLFAAFSVLLYICMIGYLLSLKDCKPTAKVLSPFIEAPFLIMQVKMFTCCKRRP